MEHDEFMDLMEVRVNKAQDFLNKQAKYDAGVKAMRTADTNGLTCNAVGCFSKAEFYGTQVHFCQSHMLIAVQS